MRGPRQLSNWQTAWCRTSCGKSTAGAPEGALNLLYTVELPLSHQMLGPKHMVPPEGDNNQPPASP